MFSSGYLSHSKIARRAVRAELRIVIKSSIGSLPSSYVSFDRGSPLMPAALPNHLAVLCPSDGGRPFLPM